MQQQSGSQLQLPLDSLVGEYQASNILAARRFREKEIRESLLELHSAPPCIDCPATMIHILQLSQISASDTNLPMHAAEGFGDIQILRTKCLLKFSALQVLPNDRIGTNSFTTKTGFSPCLAACLHIPPV